MISWVHKVCVRFAGACSVVSVFFAGVFLVSGPQKLSVDPEKCRVTFAVGVSAPPPGLTVVSSQPGGHGGSAVVSVVLLCLSAVCCV